MNEQEVQKQINELYEANFSHVDFMDNMGGECECEIHTKLIELARSIGWDAINEREVN